jgi:hypothetical protein
MTISFARHQFPPAIIQKVVWLYVRFTLSYLCSRSAGWMFHTETVWRWVLKSGPLFARELRRRRSRPTLRWHLDEMAVMIAGTQFWLWRAVDDEGEFSRPAGATATRQGCSRETDAQAGQETRLRTRCTGDGQAALLWRGKVRNGRGQYCPARPGRTCQPGARRAPATSKARNRLARTTAARS